MRIRFYAGNDLVLLLDTQKETFSEAAKGPADIQITVTQDGYFDLLDTAQRCGWTSGDKPEPDLKEYTIYCTTEPDTDPDEWGRYATITARTAKAAALKCWAELPAAVQNETVFMAEDTITGEAEIFFFSLEE